MDSHTAAGWIGSTAFAVCSFPQALHVYRQGHADGMTWSFLWLWLIGEVAYIYYIAPRGDIPLLLNYGVNLALVSAMLWYKWRPRVQIVA